MGHLKSVLHRFRCESVDLTSWHQSHSKDTKETTHDFFALEKIVLKEVMNFMNVVTGQEMSFAF